MEANHKADMINTEKSYTSFVVLLTLAEVVIIVLYGACTEFSEFADVN